MSKLAFFRQSGWMVLASTVSGLLMAMMHKAAGKMPDYGEFFALLSVLGQLGIPSVGLQLTFVQESVMAFGHGREGELKGALLSLLRWSLLLGALVAVVAYFFMPRILLSYGITDATAVWLTLVVALLSLWQPALLGVLQGQQNFLWVGWASMLNGLVRLLAVTAIVLVWDGRAGGAMLGVLLGMLVSLGVAAWPIRTLLLIPSSRFRWAPWLKRVLPLTLSLGAVTMLLTQDMITVQAFFSKMETKYYAAAALIGRTLYFLTAPMTAVLFPKIVQSSIRAEKSAVLIQALGATALLGSAAAIGCTLLPSLPLRLMYPPAFLQVTTLVPLYAWCALPLALSNVLVNNLLARERFAVAPWVVAIAFAYALTLHYRHESFAQVIHTLGLFATLLFLGCLAITWWYAKRATPPSKERDPRAATG